jgi:Asp/Glu/hydantoin racemase
MDTGRRNFIAAASVVPSVLLASSLGQNALAAETGLASQRPIRILLLNPNSSEDFTRIILREARRIAGPNVSFVPVTSRFGPKYIGTEVTIAIAAHALVSTMADVLKDDAQFDAAIIAGFGSGGTEGIQEMVSFPVVSLFRASVSAALLYGGKFSILTGGERWLPLLRKQVENAGLSSRLASIRTIPLTGVEIAADQSRAVNLLAELSQRCATEDQASCVIHGGAAVAGLAALMHQQLRCP